MEEKVLYALHTEECQSDGNMYGKMTNERATRIFCDIQRGDFGHMEELYEATKGKMQIIANKYSIEWPYMEDFFQDVWVKLIEDAEKYDKTRSGFYTWMEVIAKTIRRKQLEKGKDIKLISLDADDMPEFEAPEKVEEIVMVSEDYRNVMGKLDKLPKNQRCAIKLCMIEGYKPAEAANIAECKATDIYQNKHRGLKNLVAMMEESDVEL